jgi:thioredoxin-dependent peroxiredoxin
MPDNKKLAIGDKAPLFSLPDQDGKVFNLADHIGKSNIVLFFYPKDESYGCTKEACSFRDSYEVFTEMGAEVIGISSDDVKSHKSFASNHKLQFTLLSDTKRTVAKLYDVGRTFGVVGGRVTYIIDRSGVVRGIYNSQLNYLDHIEESLEVLKKL